MCALEDDERLSGSVELLPLRIGTSEMAEQGWELAAFILAHKQGDMSGKQALRTIRNERCETVPAHERHDGVGVLNLTPEGCT
jgi:hypothetical protein